MNDSDVCTLLSYLATSKRNADQNVPLSNEYASFRLKETEKVIVILIYEIEKIRKRLDMAQSRERRKM